jgi:hypothetical protein
MKNNHYTNTILELNKTITDRREFHKQSSLILTQMSKDQDFWNEVFKHNLTDKGYLSRKWTMYEIPFLYVFENDDFIMKIHLFVPLQNYAPHVLASAIHHHNNYLLTTVAAFGSGYETILFEKDFKVNLITKEVNLKIKDHFTQQQRPLHMVDAWEPHLVVNPTSLSATLVLWSPDKKRVTDSLRSNSLLKAMKAPLRKLIYALGLDKKVGIAAKKTYQYYIKDNKFYGILEDDYFEPTRTQAGEKVNDYSIQTVFAFMQHMKFNDINFLKKLQANPDVPKYYHKWIDKLISGDLIQDTFAKEQINVPGGRIMVEDVIKANKRVNNL